MSEFGNETATATFRASEKTIDALMKLLKYLLERNRNKVNNELRKEQLNEMKLDSEKRKAKLKLSNKVGEVNAKLLMKSGEKLRPLSIELNDKQLMEFDYYATKYGIKYSSISNQKEEGIKSRIVIVREKDLELVKDITDRMNENIKLKDLDEQIMELEGKETLTEEEKNTLLELQKQKEIIIREGTKNFNSENAEIIFSDICGQLQDKSMSFDRALNRFTDRDFSRDKPYYVCERTNPSSYIEMKSSFSKFRGKEYTRTDYRVFNNNEEQRCDTRDDGIFTDERFEGRSKNYWQTLKDEMKNKGKFSDDIVIFNTMEELEKYQLLYEKEKKKDLIEEKNINGEEYRDFVSIDKQLRKQLDERNAELGENGQVVDKESKKILSLEQEGLKTTAEKLRVAEVMSIAKAISNYEKMNNAQTMLAMNKQQYEMNESAFAVENLSKDDIRYELYEKMQNELKAKINENEKVLEKGKELESSLNLTRQRLASIQAVDEIDKEYALQHALAEVGDIEEDLNNKSTQSLDEWKENVYDERQKTSIPKESVNLDKNIEKTSLSKDDR